MTLGTVWGLQQNRGENREFSLLLQLPCQTHSLPYYRHSTPGQASSTAVTQPIGMPSPASESLVRVTAILLSMQLLQMHIWEATGTDTKP